MNHAGEQQSGVFAAECHQYQVRQQEVPIGNMDR